MANEDTTTALFQRGRKSSKRTPPTLFGVTAQHILAIKWPVRLKIIVNEEVRALALVFRLGQFSHYQVVNFSQDFSASEYHVFVTRHGPRRCEVVRQHQAKPLALCDWLTSDNRFSLCDWPPGMICEEGISVVTMMQVALSISLRSALQDFGNVVLDFPSEYRARA